MLVRGNVSEATEDHKIGLKIETGGILLEPGVPSKNPRKSQGIPEACYKLRRGTRKKKR